MTPVRFSRKLRERRYCSQLRECSCFFLPSLWNLLRLFQPHYAEFHLACLVRILSGDKLWQSGIFAH